MVTTRTCEGPGNVAAVHPTMAARLARNAKRWSAARMSRAGRRDAGGEDEEGDEQEDENMPPARKL